MRAAPLIALAAVGACTLTACTRTIDSQELERKTSAALTDKIGQKPDKIGCPDDLEATPGKTSGAC